MADADRLFGLIEQLVMSHSPSGVEAAVDTAIATELERRGIDWQQDEAGNIVATIPGRGSDRLAITAHKDEIGAIVTDVADDGSLKLRKLGGSYPWVYGEGVVDLLCDGREVQGILSFGARHISHLSPQHAQQTTAPLLWSDARIETKLSAGALAEAGVRPGTRVVVGRHRKAPLRLGDHIASYTLDNKASVAILLLLAERLRAPFPTVDLVFTSKEEIGGIGALYHARRQPADAMIALEVCPVAPEYPVRQCAEPVLIADDAFCPYDVGLTESLRRCAAANGIAVQSAVLSGFGSDASIAMKQGLVARSACLAFPTENTHGFEIAHLDAIGTCVDLLEAYCLKDAAIS